MRSAMTSKLLQKRLQALTIFFARGSAPHPPLVHRPSVCPDARVELREATTRYNEIVYWLGDQICDLGVLM
eukprot:7378340-Prymnesium_polylepis.1